MRRMTWNPYRWARVFILWCMCSAGFAWIPAPPGSQPTDMREEVEAEGRFAHLRPTQTPRTARDTDTATAQKADAATTTDGASHRTASSASVPKSAD